MTSAPQAALAVNHVGLTVPDIHAAIDWYQAVFGFRCIMGPRELEVTGHAEASSVFGVPFSPRLAGDLLTGNSVGIELFQFIDPPTSGPRPTQQRVPWQRARAVASVHHPPGRCGHGRSHRRSRRRAACAAQPIRARTTLDAGYTADPSGTVLEVMSHSYAEAFSNWPQPGIVAPTLVPRPRAMAMPSARRRIMPPCRVNRDEAIGHAGCDERPPRLPETADRYGLPLCKKSEAFGLAHMEDLNLLTNVAVTRAERLP